MLVVLDTTEEEELIHYFTNLTLRATGWYSLHSTDGLNWNSDNNVQRIFSEDLNLKFKNQGLAAGAGVDLRDENLHFIYQLRIIE